MISCDCNCASHQHSKPGGRSNMTWACHVRAGTACVLEDTRGDRYHGLLNPGLLQSGLISVGCVVSIARLVAEVGLQK